MTLAAGTKLGPYEVISPLGAGGMGEVYRARDSRLGREVAIKVLPEALAQDPERIARFEREARSASALSHAHTVAVFDVGRTGDRLYLVTEIVEGGSLRDVIDRGPVPLRRAIELAAQIASGLAAAHESGIVHRDLKPENVLIARSGEAKIADFGLAKLAEPAGGTDSHLPTSDGLSTSAGLVMGTVAYMSPEQATGRKVDYRSDQFALGAILWEMLAGRPCFRRGSAAESLSAIIRDEPEPLRAVNPAVPPQLAWIVDRCLAKEPAGRYASTRDLASEIATVRDHLSDLTAPAATEPGGPEKPGRRISRGGMLLAAAGIGAMVGGLVVFLLGRRPLLPEPTVRFEFPPPAGGVFSVGAESESVQVAVSPEGTRIAYIARAAGETPQVWVRALSETDAHPVEGTRGATSLFWSPDGRALGFFSGDKLERVDLPGGTAIPICDVAPALGFAATWGISGDILFADVLGEAIYRVAASGGTPKPVVRSDPARGEFRVLWPWFLPDGKSFLYLSYLGEGRKIRSELMLARPGKPPRSVAALRSRVEYVDPGYLVFARDGALVAQRFDASKGALVGGPVPVAPRVEYFLSTAWAGFATSRNGTIAFESNANVSRLVWFDREGRRIGEVGSPADYLDDLAISPDGEHVLSARARSDLGTYDLWVFDLSRGTETRLTSDPESEFGGLWLPGGSAIVYSAARAAPPQMTRRDLSTGAETTLLSDSRFQQAEDATRDGRTLAFVARSAGGNAGAYLLPLTGGSKPRTLLAPDFNTSALRFSPNGSFVSFASNESGKSQAYVAPVDAMGRRIPLSPTEGVRPRWSRDGSEIFYLSGHDLVSVPVRTEPSLEVAKPTILFSLPAGSRWRDYEPAPDGKRFLAVVPEIEGAAQPATAIVHWRPDAAR